MPKVELKQCAANSYTPGRGGNTIRWILIHYTATNASAANNAAYFANGGNGASSAHYFVDGGGTIYQSVAEGDTAWHAGNWYVNQRSIGIEVVSAGQDFTESEIGELGWLVRDLMNRYGIPESRVLRHYDVPTIAQGDTIDPWKRCPAPYVDAAKWAELKKRITEEEDMPLTDNDIKRIAERTRSEILGYINPKMESVDVYQVLHDMPRRTWGYNNPKFGDADAYQMLLDLTADVAALREEVAELKKQA